MSCLTSHGKVGSVVLEYKKSLVLERYFWNTTYEPYTHVRNWYTTRHFFSIPFFETI
ncbi:hypothetical protein MGG_16296 [Pyricularia oryzae 70-15]|uniref:Uncharacterized protein n=3 Tax=Pyricularia oryzae TaxID=318829 RepID=G4MRJ3_PYRO7|nr:uncharacterized protein MGG_16296 [Pyricularia oryzae 70-15]EHA57416.1 hypothetical protein MGG_16296 [Pyricularia oryzae 70-15]ELQ43546.1 hypothetical protein OOU_Y34scaffold00145g5 [Pyricularia oryzae Y34]